MARVSTWYRIVRKTFKDGTPRTRSQDVLKSGGGRFHEDPVAAPTSYGAESLLTAWMEVTSRLGRARPNPRAWKAWVVSVRAGLWVDMRKARTRKTYEISEATLYADPWPPQCRELARRARRGGAIGLIYRSVRNRPKGVCAAVFLENAKRRVRLRAVDPEDWNVFLAGLAPRGKS